MLITTPTMNGLASELEFPSCLTDFRQGAHLGGAKEPERPLLARELKPFLASDLEEWPLQSPP